MSIILPGSFGCGLAFDAGKVGLRTVDWGQLTSVSFRKKRRAMPRPTMGSLPSSLLAGTVRHCIIAGPQSSTPDLRQP